MRNILIVARHEYMVNVRRIGFIVTTALVPLLGAAGLIVAAFFGGQAADFFVSTFVPEEGDIGIVDQLWAFTPILPEYENRINTYPDEEQGRAALRSEEIDALLVIPEGYMGSGRVTIVTREGGFSAAALEGSDTLHSFFVDHLLGFAQ